MATVASCAPLLHGLASVQPPVATPEYRIEIAPCSVELSHGKFLKTIGYNGQVPGPLLRLREGQTSVIEVTNHTTDPEVVHWHGLHLSSQIDGATEEGTPAIAPGATVRYDLLARPGGFRWYHTHTFAGSSMTKAQFGGQHGFLYVEPKINPGRYDQEVFLGLHDWRGQMMSSDDGSMNPVYDTSTINGHTLGFGDPIRVRQGERLLLHVLNSSPTDQHWLAFAGHQFQVIALDGNPVPQSKSVSMLRLAPAERVTAIIKMTNPGVWVLGEVRRHVQAAGMGIVVEYSGASGKPVWHQPQELVWTYAQFARGDGIAAHESAAPSPVEEIPLVFQSRFAGHGAPERWMINGKSYPDVTSQKLVKDRRYRLRLHNASKDDHPIHLHRHTFQVTSLSDESAIGEGLMKDTILVRAGTEGTVEFVANNPGPTLLHCHQQDHMDRGFMMVFDYA
jgi:FtsP/CotA-like multicopper oxidase with cupredoxin domain